MDDFSLDIYNFELPAELIAQQPSEPRDHCRLLVYDRKNKVITDDYFYNLPKYLVSNTTLAINDTGVEKCRLRFGNLEIFITKNIDDKTVEALVRPGKKFKSNTTVNLADNISVKVLSVIDDGTRVLEFNLGINSKKLLPYRLTPLPPYIKQDESLSKKYQTVYARDYKSKAAPTAGLHFTDELIKKITKEHDIACLTLQVGLGTFAPLKESNFISNTLHSEEVMLDSENAKILNMAKHITAVGTTSVRTLESIRADDGFHEFSGATDIFIRPGYEFKAVDSIITNFHLPKSSLLMLIGAFVGVEEMMKIYSHAIEQRYMFYSFGDAMLII